MPTKNIVSYCPARSLSLSRRSLRAWRFHSFIFTSHFFVLPSFLRIPSPILHVCFLDFSRKKKDCDTSSRPTTTATQLRHIAFSKQIVPSACNHAAEGRSLAEGKKHSLSCTFPFARLGSREKNREETQLY